MSYNPNNPNGQATMANSAPVVIASDQSAVPVTGTFYQATQPVSIASSVAVTGTFWQATQPVSLASLPSLAAGSNAIGSITNTAFGISGTLPAFASTPTVNIGTIGTIATESTLSTLNTKIPSNLTVTSTRLLVDGSGVTQPVSGTVTANISGSISNTSFAVTQATAASLNATVVGTGTFAVQAAQSGTWNIGTLTSITNAVTVSQGTATSLKTQAESYQGGTAVSSTNPLYVTVASSTSGGDSTFHLVSAATTNATNIKASAGKVTGWYIYNSNASARKVNFYNSSTTPILGTTVLHSAIIIPGLAAANVSFPNGIDFGTGIGIATVTELTDAGNTAVALNDLIINIYYK